MMIKTVDAVSIQEPFDSQSTLSFNGVPGMYVITLDFGSVIKHYKVVKN